MEKPRHVSDEKTRDLPGGLTQDQEPVPAKADVYPSLGVVAAGTSIAGRYVVEAEVPAFGGEADVFVCRDKESGEKVAVKVYRANIQPKAELMSMLRDLRHENIVSLLDFDSWGGRFLEVMQYAEGGSLAACIPFDEDSVTGAILPQLVEGLRFLHDHRVVHRDLKPSNLFFHDKTRRHVLIADYGTSSLIEEWEGSLHLSSSLRGTIDYAAPESFSGIFGREVDYYALGITLLALLSGDTPFKSMNRAMIMHCHLAERIHPPESSSPRFKDLIAGLLCKERTERWGCGEVRRWLRGEDVPVPSFRPLQSAFSYTLDEGHVAHSVKELGELLLAKPTQAKKHIQQRLVYDVIKTRDQALASRLSDIQSQADSLDACLVEIAYTLNPDIPYRLTEGCEAASPQELARLIDCDAHTWTAGREQLRNGMIPAWLRATGYGSIAEAWQQVSAKFFSS